MKTYLVHVIGIKIFKKLNYEDNDQIICKVCSVDILQVYWKP